MVLVEADAVAADRAVVPIGSAVLAASGVLAGTPVWLVAGRGRRLPAAMVAAIVARTVPEHDPLAADVEVLAVSTVARVAGPAGVVTCSPAALAAECELAPELLRSSPM